LRPNEKLVEAELCARLGVSRTPLREALKVLDNEGLIAILPHRGARVTEITPEEAGDLFEVLASLEGLAAELATQRMAEQDLARLEERHLRMRQYHSARRRHDYFKLNHKIHQLIVTLSGNTVLAATHTRLMVQARRSRYMAILSQARWNEAMDEHHVVMEAFRDRDAEKAARIWRQHVLRTGEVVRATIDPERFAKGRPELYAEV
jgi:DNA-binding GntR family transcriptional regulator